MPLPKKKSGESKDEFVNRCMSSEVMKEEYPDKDQRLAVCNNQVEECEDCQLPKKGENMTTVENLEFQFKPKNYKIEEGRTEGKNGEKGKQWLKIGGVALEECVSKNKNKYEVKNLQENHDKNFKWLVGHPKSPERHVVGKGVLEFDGKQKLFHEGKIRNTSEHPDVVEQVKDGFLEPSIHATAKKVKKEEDGSYAMEGLSIDGVGLVAFKGVSGANINYAVAESFENRMNKTESNNDEVNQKMSEEKEKNENKEDVKEQAGSKEKSGVSLDKYESVKEELRKLKEEKKQVEEKHKLEEKKKLVKQILEINEEFEEEKLMEESKDKLQTILEYEKTLQEKKSQKPKGAGIVDAEEDDDKEKLVESEHGIRISEDSWKKFNESIRERVI